MTYVHWISGHCNRYLQASKKFFSFNLQLFNRKHTKFVHTDMRIFGSLGKLQQLHTYPTLRKKNYRKNNTKNSKTFELATLRIKADLFRFFRNVRVFSASLMALLVYFTFCHFLLSFLYDFCNFFFWNKRIRYLLLIYKQLLLIVQRQLVCVTSTHTHKPPQSQAQPDTRLHRKAHTEMPAQ